MSLKFTKSDFHVPTISKLLTPNEAVQMANAKVKQWLSEQKKMYGCTTDDGDVEIWALTKDRGEVDTHIITIAEIRELK